MKHSSKYESFINMHGLGNVTPRSKVIAMDILRSPEKTYKEIANSHGITRQRVGQIARRLDIGRITSGEAADTVA